MKEVVLAKSGQFAGHYCIDGIPVYILVSSLRERLNLNRSEYVERMKLERSGHYAFEAGDRQNVTMVLKELEAAGEEPTIIIRGDKIV